MEAKHTPGPWRNASGTIFNASNGKVAEAGSPGYDGFAAESEDESVANARLIAAAPTMYEYLARRSASGDDEASTILESIHGRAQGNGSVERRQG